MADSSTLARPYAKAVFGLSLEGGTFQRWSAQLAALSAAVVSPQISALIGHPLVSKANLAEVVVKALGDELGVHGRALVELLCANGRLQVAPQLQQQFEALRAEHEVRAGVEVVSAVPVEPAQRDALFQAISKRLGRTVEMTWSVDESLIAGALFRTGDLVIDGSARGELARLQTALARP